MHNEHTLPGAGKAISDPISIAHVAEEISVAQDFIRCVELAANSLPVDNASAFGRVLDEANLHLIAAVRMIEMIMGSAGAGEAGR